MEVRNNKELGFTLIELLAIIVILAIILAVAIPNIVGMINASSMSSFKSDAKMFLQAVKYKQLEDKYFNPLSITKDNVSELLGISTNNYDQVHVKLEDGNVNLFLVGINKWDGLFACGTMTDMKVVKTITECSDDVVPPTITMLGQSVVNIGLGVRYLDAGAIALDEVDGDLTNNIVTSNSVNINAAGTYNVVYSVSDATGNVSTVVRTVNVFEKEFIYNYTANYQTFTVPLTGEYKMELWGAQGGASLSKGAYTSGKINLDKDQLLYVYVGQGNVTVSNGSSFNGGTGDNGGYPGGGATDVRLVSGTWNNFDSLKSRIMVAAGSGSGQGDSTINLGYGGTLAGGAGGGTQGGTQTAAGNRQVTSYALSGFGYANGGCAGGGGYYGGGASTCVSGAGGGSSFISGYTGCNAITATSTSTSITHTGQPNHYSGKIFTGGVIVAGNASMPTYDGSSTMIGNAGNGYAKITYVDDNDANLSITINGDQTVEVLLGGTYTDLGATAKDGNGADITVNIATTGTVNPNVAGTYTITYDVVDTNGHVAYATRTVKVLSVDYAFSYTGNYQTFVVPQTGIYKIQLWGAQGATSISKGAYTSGKINLAKDEILYVYVGQGNANVSNGTSFNGGTGSSGGAPGGGATDVRLISGTWNDFNSLKSRLMVAAGSGSGSGNNTVNLGYGGALSGGAGGGTPGGTQTSAGARQSTSYTLSGFGYANGGCAGGGGYYGGGAATCVNGAGGGSSFISGYTGCNAITATSTSTSVVHTGQPNHYSGKVFNDSIMIAGNASMPTYDGRSTMIGNASNGYAVISYIGS